MIIPNDTTIAVVDGTRFRMFRNHGAEPQIKLVELAQPEVDARNQGSGGRHHTGSANPDDSRIEEDNFAAAVAGFLNRQVLDGKITGLFVIADPRTLGELRRHYHKMVEAKLVGELAKDFTGDGVSVIEAALVKIRTYRTEPNI
jgi:protein required for attachment to host cells